MRGFVVLLGLFVFQSSFSAQEKKSISLKRLYTPGGQASSFLQSNWNKYQENYHPNYAFDGNPTTAWVEGAEGEGIGETLSWRVSSLESAARVVLKIKNGYQKSAKLFKANGAPRKIELSLLSEAKKVVARSTYELKNSMGSQDIEISIPKERGFSFVELKVLSVYPGKTYKDTCISDIETFVESKVPYNEKAELAKYDELKKWVKKRLEDAQYFSKLPVEYPFASAVFKVKDEKSTSEEGPPECASLVVTPFSSQLEAATKGEAIRAVFSERDFKFISDAFKQSAKLRSEKSWYRVALSGVAKSIRSPDIAGVEWLAERTLPLVGTHLLAEQLSFFESKEASSEAFRPSDAPQDLQSWRLHSNYKIQLKGASPKVLYFWVKDIGVERGVWEAQKHYLLTYNDNRRLESILVWMPSSSEVVRGHEVDLKKEIVKPSSDNFLFDPARLALFEFDYKGGSKVHSLSIKTADYSEYDCGYNSFNYKKYEAVDAPLVKAR